ncbi:MAG: type II and III secretion system protein family protein [Alphaproteobacteria bacterium GM7ARS4]|nr:type II and III secretion system protein family protein [Alphaproteobacteria bacterium GM7ARS4]
MIRYNDTSIRAVGHRLWRQGLRVTALCAVVLGCWAGYWAMPLYGEDNPPELGDDYQYDIVEVEVSQAKVVATEDALLDIFVADPSVADVQVSSANTFYIYGRQPGRTTVICYGLNQKVVRVLDLRVAYNVSELKNTIDTLLPDSRIDVLSTPRGIMLTGQVDTPQGSLTARRLSEQYLQALGAESDLLIDNVAVAGANQVNLQVRVAEVSREVGELIGVNLEGARTAGDHQVFSAFRRTFRQDRSQQGGGSSSSQQNQSDIVDITGNIITEVSRASAENLLLGFSGAWGAFYAMLDLLEDENLVTTLAKPNLTALSGETASFLAGGEIGVPTAGGNNQGTSVTFRPFGVSLEFTPTILTSGRISLNINVEVSNVSSSNLVTADGLRIPSLSTRRASTTVDMASGQSFAIAGLLQSDLNSAVDQYPFLSHIPVLGALFRSDSFRRRESELVIIVTPLVVEPVSTEVLRTPLDDGHFNTQVERVLTRRIFEYQPDTEERGEDVLRLPGYLDIGGFMVK